MPLELAECVKSPLVSLFVTRACGIGIPEATFADQLDCIGQPTRIVRHIYHFGDYVSYKPYCKTALASWKIAATNPRIAHHRMIATPSFDGGRVRE
ncbi:hypothetical protein [Sphingomonas sp. 10B4]|uniref:hypothetical protein n=1 Tax=Sphingomonas sp. 10B4 TaxID=3048575 RepID=UPI002AB5DA6F|nr:hypothetical protein [Sphingomonas sp. 10B4]MDY7525465.1 hypothetical protein [Sphingomonas sp. 10B4]MEB0281409.1 hypothetical protein [Sphingomonas sp. 10B4]